MTSTSDTAAQELRGPAIPPFYAGEIGRRAAARARAGLPVIAMNFGQPSSGAPAEAIAAAHRALDADPLGYHESVPLAERLSRHYRECYGVTVEPGRILHTAGASAAFVAAYAALFRRGDRVALVTPGYPAYRNTLRAMGLVPVELRCGPEHGFRPTAAMIESLDPAPAGFVLANPANPTGTMLDSSEFGAIVDVCRRRGVRLISDEIYHGITFGPRPVSALEHDPDTVVVNSFSKLYRMPGWRLGWMVVPQRWVAGVSAYLINMFLTPPTLAQHAALAALDARDELQASVDVYARNRQRLIAGLASLGIVDLAPPDGAFYLYADIGHLTDNSLGFCTRLVEDTGVALAPGIDFDPQQGQSFVRFSFAVSPEEIERALELLAAWLAGPGKPSGPVTLRK
jgi:aspartate/methionine/tyrosine aminotransferase